MHVLILASTSPRRKELLALLQIPFEVVAPSFEETLHPDQPAAEQAKTFAREKARSCAGQHPQALVLGSDTVIAYEQEIFGKPVDATQAHVMLAQLAGREHLIYTAVSAQCVQKQIDDTRVEVVRVWMKAAREADIEAYVATGEWQGKAGGYAIQGHGARLIESIQGDFTAVMGLPLRVVADVLNTYGLAIRVDLDRLYRSKPYGNWARFP